MSPVKQMKVSTNPVVASSSRGDLKSFLFIAGTLIILLLLCYWQVWKFGFVNYDDTDYVTQNPWIQKGINQETLKWAFTTGYASNWHPLTWVSHMLDWQLYGEKAGGHHFTNVLLHIANTLLLLTLLRKITGSIWRSGLVAALFALHPLHVESVAWVSERKDVLSTFFGFLSFLCYARYVAIGKFAGSHKTSAGMTAYAGAVLLFAFSLLSKPMFVTMPFLLLLLDLWPFQRFSGTGSTQKLTKVGLFLEKVPFILPSILSCIVTVSVQAGKTMQTLSDLSVSDRISNALVAYVTYLAKAIWPSDLAFFYPLLGAPPIGKAIVSAALLLLISATTLAARKKKPYLLVGWLWYLGSLVPVIGIIHVGEQSMADRYTYLPLVGVFIALVWWLAERISSGLHSRPSLQRTFAAAALPGVIFLALLTHRQISFWRDSKTMLERALAVTKDNFLAHNNFGVVLADNGKYGIAIDHYRRAVAIKPHYARAYSNLGAALALNGQFEEAIQNLEKALSLRPSDAETHYNLAVTLAQLGNFRGTIEHCRQALALNPQYKVAHYDLGLALSLVGENREAVEQFRIYLGHFPEDAAAQQLLSKALQKIEAPN